MPVSKTDDSSKWRCRLKKHLLCLYAAFFACCYLLPSPSSAIKQYRCNGMIQYKPCSQDSIDSDFYSPQGIEAGGFAEAESSKLTFKDLGMNLGEWRGEIHGSGYTSIWLLLYDNNRTLIEQRIIGRKKIDSKLSFNYRSKLPLVDNWSWKIKAIKDPAHSRN